MAIVKYVKGIDSFRGAVDTIKEGKQNRRHLISRWRPQGPQSYDTDGGKLHELFYMNFHEGAWSDGATRNREMIKTAQRMAHEIERICGHPKEYAPELVTEAEQWIDRYAVYRAGIPQDSKKYYHFYTFVYTTILRALRE